MITPITPVIQGPLPIPKGSFSALPAAKEVFAQQKNTVANRKIKQVSVLKTWEVLVCTISIIGLLILLGIYLGRMYGKPECFPLFLKPILPLDANTDYETALKSQKETIIKSHKNWKQFDTQLKEFSLEDQVLILQLMELDLLGINLDLVERQIGLTLSEESIPNASKKHLQSLLENKPLIAKALANWKTLEVVNIKLTKVPDAIGLLVNLERAFFLKNHMKTPPNLTHNRKLKELIINSNDLKSPPNLKMNPELELVDLFENDLTECPDVSQNPLLEALYLHENEIDLPPDVDQNPLLQSLKLYANPLTSPPKVDRNPELLVLDLAGSELTFPPDLTKNKKLRELVLDDNKLSDPPNISNNTELTFFNVNANLLTSLPDFSNNTKIEVIRASGNKLKEIPSIGKENTQLHTLCLANNNLQAKDKAQLQKSFGNRPDFVLEL